MRLRTVLMAVVLAGGLGCSGLGQKLLDVTGSEVHVGADAVHPADFPLPPPPEGTLVASASLNVGGMKNTTLQYEVPSAEGLLDRYETIMKDAGLSPTRGTQAGGETVSAETVDHVTQTAMVGDQAGKTMLTLSSVKLPGE